ncbi:DUF1289 domain-containing protein [Andreprevotia sp. IGB-42]|uniref:DUF1289 domain-containing protein n=1 Tax=Andreprevotia sp. IGB-42 TaxID=2497473 RepID=UPI0027E57437|nr:DUF1289 domain-containing protein [Andreprevotia sp. IGB-42]
MGFRRLDPQPHPGAAYAGGLPAGRARCGVSMQSPVPSPCIQRCQLDGTQTCTGCRRTMAEIIAWPSLDEAGKVAVWQRLLALPMPVRQKHCQQCGAAFTCGSGGVDGGCWCMEVAPVLPLPSSATGEGDCLCAGCLMRHRASLTNNG